MRVDDGGDDWGGVRLWVGGGPLRDTARALPFYGSPKYRKRGSTSDTDFWLALLGFDFLLLENVMRVKSPSNQENSRSPATSLDFGPRRPRR